MLFWKKLLALTEWKKKYSIKEFNFLNYYQNTFLSIILVLIIQVDKVTEKKQLSFSLFFFLLKGAALNLNWIFWNLAIRGHFLSVIWNMKFLDQCFSNFNVHMNHLKFFMKYRFSYRKYLVGLERLVSSALGDAVADSQGPRCC